jgi:hypothetical protein
MRTWKTTISLCFKRKAGFVASLHLIFKEPNLDSDLSIPPRAPSRVCKVLGYQFNDFGILKTRAL